MTYIRVTGYMKIAIVLSNQNILEFSLGFSSNHTCIDYYLKLQLFINESILIIGLFLEIDKFNWNDILLKAQD